MVIYRLNNYNNFEGVDEFMPIFKIKCAQPLGAAFLGLLSKLGLLVAGSHVCGQHFVYENAANPACMVFASLVCDCELSSGHCWLCWLLMEPKRKESMKVVVNSAH
ncbi:hypothetical protein DUNSADRAFT_5890 [Dunaliella salina]|uniref:Encoded protein n=1 Tax=Dunaliella salina TaxID=3046 RepID=A0ABQ7GPH4_DUNSA|nr:hypothetical protein DUNSADRAFT_5890 [Dunaliella salina]|eukprot:KAF5836504.1 hypothetical protein DUNSADRAFT_5890 [Dunaliella salina]